MSGIINNSYVITLSLYNELWQNRFKIALTKTLYTINYSVEIIA